LNLPSSWLYCSSYAKNEVTQRRKEAGPKDRLWQNSYETWTPQSPAPAEEQAAEKSQPHFGDFQI